MFVAARLAAILFNGMIHFACVMLGVGHTMVDPVAKHGIPPKGTDLDSMSHWELELTAHG